MSVNQKSTRSRAPNFTRQDQLLLLEAMKPYINIIESKQTDKIKQVDKQIAWSKVTNKFNANTVGQVRTTDNLLSCYRNIKSKIKKEHSEAKMLIVDPTQRNALLDAIEEEGKDWERVASTSSWGDPKVCEEGFEELKKEAEKEERKRKKFVMGTGGGPHLPEKDEHEFSKIKKLIEPQIDGLFTVYDGDAELMTQFQATVPEGQGIEPIEVNFIKCATTPQETTMSVEHNMTSEMLNTPTLSRTDILRKKKEPALCLKEPTSRKTVQDSYKQLSEAKLELVSIQKKIAELEYEHRKERQKIEIEELLKENKFKEKLREKELELLQIKINKARNE